MQPVPRLAPCPCRPLVFSPVYEFTTGLDRGWTSPGYSISCSAMRVLRSMRVLRLRVLRSCPSITCPSVTGYSISCSALRVLRSALRCVFFDPFLRSLRFLSFDPPHARRSLIKGISRCLHARRHRVSACILLCGARLVDRWTRQDRFCRRRVAAKNGRPFQSI